MSGATFEVGKTYRARSIVDHTFFWTFTVVARTAKFVTLEGHDKTVRVGVKTSDEGEWALPNGSYSMAPVLRAINPN